MWTRYKAYERQTGSRDSDLTRDVTFDRIAAVFHVKQDMGCLMVVRAYSEIFLFLRT